MQQLTKSERHYLRGYANALQELMYRLTGNNSCAKSYDPIDFTDDKIHSYAFDLKDGGRHHPLSDYESVDEICQLMKNEAESWIIDYFKNG